MPSPWEQSYWEQPAIDQLGPYQPEPYDQPRFATPEPEYPQMDEFGQPEVSGSVPAYEPFRRSRVGRVFNAGVEGVASTIAGAARVPGAAWDYLSEDPEAAKPSAGAGRVPGPAINAAESPMGAPNVGPDPVPEFLGRANETLLGALQSANPPRTDVRAGFSWGKDVPLGENGRPMIDSAIGKESTGGGGYMPSADPESMPWGQRPQSWKDDQREQLGFAMAQAKLRQELNLANDPNQLGAYRQRKAIDLETSAADRKQQMDEDQGQFTVLNNRRDERLRRLEAKRATLTPEQIKQLQGDIEDEFNRDRLAYQQARFAARGGAPPNNLYRQQ